MVVWEMAAILCRPQCVKKRKNILYTSINIAGEPTDEVRLTRFLIAYNGNELTWKKHISYMPSIVSQGWEFEQLLKQEEYQKAMFW